MFSLKKKLDGDENLKKEYDAIFRMYEKEGIIKRVNKAEDLGNPGEIHYLPHRPVVKNERETTKVRPVFDA